MNSMNSRPLPPHPQLDTEVLLQRIKPDGFARLLGPMMLFLTGSAGCLPYPLPVGSAIGDALKTSHFHKALQQRQLNSMASRPILGETSGQLSQHMTG